MLVVWHTETAVPMRTYLTPHKNGVKTMDLSACSQFIATLGAEAEPREGDPEGKDCSAQTLSIWKWQDTGLTQPIAST